MVIFMGEVTLLSYTAFTVEDEVWIYDTIGPSNKHP
jgi:hypothetical protein